MRSRLVSDRTGAWTVATRQQASRIVRETAFAIQSDIIQGMTGPHSGRVYDNHQASAPGEMPAVDTSTLLGSLDVDAEPGSLTATVYVSAEYSEFLEFGAAGANLAPRPFMTPAAEGQRQPFARKMQTIGGMR
jgi:hypothetical protein